MRPSFRLTLLSFRLREIISYLMGEKSLPSRNDTFCQIVFGPYYLALLNAVFDAQFASNGNNTARGVSKRSEGQPLEF